MSKLVNKLLGSVAMIGLMLLGAAVRAETPTRAETILQRMTLDEKLGQLVQRAGGRSKDLNSKLSEEELERVRAGQVGSYLHVAGAEPLRELQRVAVEESRLGIPLLFAMDVVHGYRTIFPVPLAMAATWSPSTVQAAARIAAVEASAAGLHWTFAPMVDIARDPRWGRIVEGAGEDPFLGSVMARAQVRGFQGKALSDADSIVATAKHFGAYGAAVGGRDYNSAELSERSLHEVYLPPFFAAIRAGTGSMMTAFNDIGGVPTTSNKVLLRGLMREQWGFEGLLVSDWNAIDELIAHGVAADRGEAAALALSASVDMDMVADVYANDLKAKVLADSALGDHLDQAVLRILQAKLDLGLFDRPFQYHDVKRETALMLTPAHRAAAREAAAQAIVLLNNDDGLLPIEAASIRSLAVIGSLADDNSSALGSWRAQGRVDDVVSLLVGLRQALPSIEVGYAAGADPRSSDLAGIDQAVALSEASDLTVLMIGEHFDLSGEARSRSDITLPISQSVLAERILATGKPVVVLLANGRPLALPWLAEHASTLLETWMLGVESGPAIAEVLLGKRAPGGKLPVQYPHSSGGVPSNFGERPSGRPAEADLAKDTVRYRDQPITPLFAFGHGLSYAPFEYTELHQSSQTLARGQTLRLSFDVRNAGTLRADEVAQLYVRDPVATVARPLLELRGFQRVGLAPGERQRVDFVLSPEQFGLYALDGKWRVEAGRIDFSIGSSSQDIRLRGSFELTQSFESGVPAAAVEAIEGKPSAAIQAAPEAVAVPGGKVGRIRQYDPALDRIIAKDALSEILADGFQWSEGPVWIAEQSALLFNDVPANTMYRWSRSDGLEIFLQPSGLSGPDPEQVFREPGANGMVFEAPGQLLVADHGNRAVVRLDLASKQKTSLADRFQGRRFNSPNDLARRRDGVLFFTDPPYGLRDLDQSSAKEQPHNGVYRVDLDGSVSLLDASLSFPNGIALSPDQDVLYVANSDPQKPVWIRYTLDQSGNVTQRKLFADASDLLAAGDQGLPDGMAVASNGVIFATGPGGVLVFAADGTRLGRIETGTAIANCAFGEAGSTLFMTAHDKLILVPLLLRGAGF